MNGVQRVALQAQSGVRPVIEDLDELAMTLGFDNVVVKTPRAEVKLRSGVWAQIPLIIECIIQETDYRVVIFFNKGYPGVKPSLYVLRTEDKSCEFNSTINCFEPPKSFVEGRTNELNDFLEEIFDDHSRYMVKLIQYARSVWSRGDDVQEVTIESAGEMDTLLIEEGVERDTVVSEGKKLVSYRCRNCRLHLFTSDQIESHGQKEVDDSNTDSISSKGMKRKECKSLYLSEAPDWLSLESEGKVLCPNLKCQSKLGCWSWTGSPCSCGIWQCPNFQFTPSKIDSNVANSSAVIRSIQPVSEIEFHS